MLEEIKLSDEPRLRVEQAIKQAMTIYMNKLDKGSIEVGLEKSFQMYFAEILKQLLDINTFFPDEKFSVLFECNRPINGYNDYIDIIITHCRGIERKEFLIELKFKKTTDAASDLSHVMSYIDIFNLDLQKRKCKCVEDCYFIFLTNFRSYTTPKNSVTKFELPMYDDYTIKKNTTYKVSKDFAIKKTLNYVNGFNFSADYKINYIHSKVAEKDYWYYIIKI